MTKTKKMMTHNLEQRWSQLEPDPEKNVFQLYDSAHPLRFYIGRDLKGSRLLLLVTPERPLDLPDLKSIQIQVLKREDGNWSLLLSLKNNVLSPVFALLCSDLLISSKKIIDPKVGFGFVLKRLSNWRRLLEKDGNGLLSAAEIRGLYGELIFLRSFVSGVDVLTAVKSWVGPDGGAQDFHLADRAWEIKTIRPDAPSVRISSEDQLYSDIRSILLEVFCLNEIQDRTTGGHGLTLNDLVIDLRELFSGDFAALDIFDAKLATIGYVARPEYDLPIFSVAKRQTFDVSADFPRLTPRDLPSGISKVSYDLKLDICYPFSVSDDL